jgi:hypothetical protein
MQITGTPLAWQARKRRSRCGLERRAVSARSSNTDMMGLQFFDRIGCRTRCAPGRRALPKEIRFEHALDSRHSINYRLAMRIAFKEWAIVVDALGRGEQIIILRKGGITEGRRGFRPEHSEFLLFPTLFHQQRDSVVPAAQVRYDQIEPGLPAKDRLRLEFFCEVASVRRFDSLAAAERLRGQHIWCDEVIAARFDWGKEKAIHALAVRVFRLRQTVELPVRESYGGCKSWIELETDVATDDAKPVLSARAFARRLNQFSRRSGADRAAGIKQ